MHFSGLNDDNMLMLTQDKHSQSLCRLICAAWGCEGRASPAAVNGHSHKVADKDSHANGQRSQHLHQRQGLIVRQRIIREQ